MVEEEEIKQLSTVVPVRCTCTRRQVCMTWFWCLLLARSMWLSLRPWQWLLRLLLPMHDLLSNQNFSLLFWSTELTRGAVAGECWGRRRPGWSILGGIQADACSSLLCWSHIYIYACKNSNHIILKVIGVLKKLKV